MERNIEEYISGYVNGEGCFSVSFSRRKKMLVGWETKPSFSVSQNQDRSEVLFLIQKIVPHFLQHPLLSAKQNDFLKFRKVCLMMEKQKHKQGSGLKDIMKIAFTMNSGSKRKYSKINILKLLDEDIVNAARKSGEEHEVPTRTNSVMTGQLSRGIAR